MNEIFDIRRFGKCLKSDLTAAASKYGVTLAVLSLLGLIVYLLEALPRLFAGDFQDGSCFHGVSSPFLFAVAGIILITGMPSALYGHVTEKRSGSDYLMLPCSHAEKYLSMVLVCLVIIPLVFLCVYAGLDAVIAVFEKHYYPVTGVFSPLSEVNTVFAARWLVGADCFNFIFQISVFLLGALWFKKHKIIYTILSYAALAVVAGFAFFVNCAMFYDVEGIAAGMQKSATISGIVLELAILVLIWFRLKKLQH